MTLEDLVHGRELPIIEYRSYCNVPGYGTIDALLGYCSYENGQLTSLDGDIYSLDAKIERYEEYTLRNGKRILCVWEESDDYCG